MATQAELEAELVTLKTAINKILTGAQSVTSPNGAIMMRATLQTLYDEKNRLEKRITKISNSGNKIRPVSIS